ncbi:MAG: hypothetical protein ACKPKO_09065, partial [Candidatus Fonsibacter sp.]
MKHSKQEVTQVCIDHGLQHLPAKSTSKKRNYRTGTNLQKQADGPQSGAGCNAADSAVGTSV